MTRGLYFVFTSLIVGFGYAQQSCSQLLNHAEDLYTDGKLLDIPGLISTCVENPDGYTEAEQIRAHKLLTKVYIFTDNEAAAEDELVRLLTVDPVHEIQREDSGELRVLMGKFRTWPIFRLEIRVGGNTNVKSVLQEFTAVSPNMEDKKYAESVGLGIQAEMDITRYWDIGIEYGAGFQFRSSSYNVTSRPASLEEVFETDITNSQTMFRLPVFVRYNRNYDSRTGLVPYAFLGASLDYISSAKYTNAGRSGGTAFSLGSSDGDLKNFDQVNEINYSLFGGVGAKFRLKKGNFFFAEARFDKSLKIYNVPAERYSNPVINGDLLYVEDDLYLNFVSLNAGFIFSVYKPEKLTK